MKETKFKKNIKSFALCGVGTVIFCLGTIYFIVPANLYSGGVLGLAQLIRTLILNAFPSVDNIGIDIAGIISLSINLPLFALGYKGLSKMFVAKTAFSLMLQTLIFSLLPAPTTPLVDDVLTGCIIGGFITGIGIGFTLSSGATAGGIDIAGMYLCSKLRSLSVGTFSIMFNTALFTGCAIIFDISTAIYSTISIFIFSYIADRWHYQNVRIMAITFTKCQDLPADIIREMNRGVTQWQGKGSYTMDDKLIFITVISKREVAKLTYLIKSRDKDAFIILSNGLDVIGNYEKRLTE